MNIRNTLPIVLAGALLLGGGLIHGNWTNRWGDSPELRYASEALPRLPKNIGDWVSEDIPPTESQQRAYLVAQLRAAVTRVYTNRKTGEQISILAVCGPPGPIGTHTPEACYNGVGYLMSVPPFRVDFPTENPKGRPDTFWCSDFRRYPETARSGLKIYWSFRAGAPGTRWVAANSPRGDFARYRALYKVYVIHDMPMVGASPVDDAVAPAFIRQLVPALEATVFRAIDSESKRPVPSPAA